VGKTIRQVCKAAQRPPRQHHLDLVGTLPLNLYETQTSLNPLDLQFVFPHTQSSVPGESEESPKSESNEEPVEVLACMINVTTTAAAKVETVSRMRMVQMMEVVSVWLCQQGLEEKECSPSE